MGHGFGDAAFWPDYEDYCKKERLVIDNNAGTGRVPARGAAPHWTIRVVSV